MTCLYKQFCNEQYFYHQSQYCSTKVKITYINELLCMCIFDTNDFKSLTLNNSPNSWPTVVWAEISLLIQVFLVIHGSAKIFILI